MLDLEVKAININPRMRHPILQKCRPLYEYSMFIEQIHRELCNGYTETEAIRNSIETCREQGWLMEFLDRYGSEVENMPYTQFNLKDAKEVWEEEAREIGMKKGRARVNQLNKLLSALQESDIFAVFHRGRIWCRLDFASLH